MAVNAVQQNKTVADPNAAYESVYPLWIRNRAVCSGERFVKELDATVDTTGLRNLLIPFSPSMSQEQFNFYKAEAELPGVVSQYTKMVVGGLLRKTPQITLPDACPKGTQEWLLNNFGEDDKSLTAFLDAALWEEMQTSRTWVHVDFPRITNPDQYTKEELQLFKPYPILWKAENVVNWTLSRDNVTGAQKLTRVIVRMFEEDFSENEFHPKLVDTVYVHELVDDLYQVRVFQRASSTTSVPVIAGQTVDDKTRTGPVFELKETKTDILMGGERLNRIPAWPLNGNYNCQEPILTALVDKEIALYNKISRRNHLLLGAATYTPVLSANISDDDFNRIVNKGLGSWIRLNQGDTATILETPSGALADMDRAIAAGLEEMAKLGVRMLAPETAQSGVALELRNAAQNAQLGTLNAKVSSQMCDIIAFMVNWRYNTDIDTTDFLFSLSADFTPAPLGPDWLRLITEWYEAGLIPRNIWLNILKQNDIMPPEYDDEQGQKDINDDELLVNKQEQAKLQNALQTGAFNVQYGGYQGEQPDQQPDRQPPSQ